MPAVREIAVFGGSAHPALTAEICAFLAVPQQPVQLERFANDCLEVQLQANCRERDVFIIQPLVNPVLDLFGRKEYVVTADARPAPEVVQAEIRRKLSLPPQKQQESQENASA